MKVPWKAVIAAGALLAGAIVACLFYFHADSDFNGPKIVAETKDTLRNQGLKIDLSELIISPTPEERQRSIAIASYGIQGSSHRKLPRYRFLKAAEPDKAIVIWKANNAAMLAESDREYGPWEEPLGDYWATLETLYGKQDPALESLVHATMAGPFRFDLNPRAGYSLLLPHLAVLKNAQEALAYRTVLALHHAKADEAWTNLLAMTRLVSGWRIEPVEVSHQVRFEIMNSDFVATWQALQAREWSDAQLRQLQQEWESVDFFSSLPDTMAVNRASHLDMIDKERNKKVTSPFSGIPLKEIVLSPAMDFRLLTRGRQDEDYRAKNSYLDERDILLFYQRKELDLREAIKAASWSKMRQLPAVLNNEPFTSKFSSRVQSLANMRQLSMRFRYREHGFLGGAAVAEARRRVLITAICLERYRLQHGTYPQSLNQLVPEYLKSEPEDFMDGQSLRYKPPQNDQFVLYSVDMDCVDDFGVLVREMDEFHPNEIAEQGDLVWPRAASPDETDLYVAKATAARERAIQESYMKIDDAEDELDRALPKLVQEILRPPRKPITANPTINGNSLTALIGNTSNPGASLEELLTLRPIKTGGEPEKLAFELPIKHDAVTNLCDVRLIIDTDQESSYMDQELTNAANGNCLFTWNTTYYAPGTHVLRVELCAAGERTTFIGPNLQVATTNLCRFHHQYDSYDNSGAIIYARLAESNASYIVTLHSPVGEPIKTFSGSTTNGVIRHKWDLKTDTGGIYTNGEFSSIFSIKLLESQRTQTLKGP